MNRLELIERMWISDDSRKYQGWSADAMKAAKDALFNSSNQELVEDFNLISRDCHVEYLGNNEFIVTVKAVLPYYRSKYSRF